MAAEVALERHLPRVRPTVQAKCLGLGKCFRTLRAAVQTLPRVVLHVLVQGGRPLEPLAAHLAAQRLPLDVPQFARVTLDVPSQVGGVRKRHRALGTGVRLPGQVSIHVPSNGLLPGECFSADVTLAGGSFG